jgi:hypothetical protein
MTTKEREVVYVLAEVWNKFLELPKEHEDDESEFRRGIHQLQYMIMARGARRKEWSEDEALTLFIKNFNKEQIENRAECLRCKGRGKISSSYDTHCNCGSGEGCGQHDAFWMEKCPDCKGVGFFNMKENK